MHAILSLELVVQSYRTCNGSGPSLHSATYSRYILPVGTSSWSCFRSSWNLSLEWGIVNHMRQLIIRLTVFHHQRCNFNCISQCQHVSVSCGISDFLTAQHHRSCCQTKLLQIFAEIQVPEANAWAILTLSSPVVSNGYTSKCLGPYWCNPPL